MSKRKVYTIQRSFSLTDANLQKLRQAVGDITDPRSFSFNDGWAHKAFIERWGISVSEAQEVLKQADKKAKKGKHRVTT